MASYSHSGQPDRALQLLKAGADPSIRDDQGHSIAERVQLKLKFSPDYPQVEAARLLEWLKNMVRQ